MRPCFELPGIPLWQKGTRDDSSLWEEGAGTSPWRGFGVSPNSPQSSPKTGRPPQEEWGTKGVDKPLMHRGRAWIPACAGTTRGACQRGAVPLRFSSIPHEWGTKGVDSGPCRDGAAGCCRGLESVSPSPLPSPLDGRWFRLVQGVKRGRAPLLLFLSPKSGGQRGLTGHCSAVSTNRPGSTQYCGASLIQFGLVGLSHRVRANIYRQIAQNRQGGSIKRG
jgi:hypothetical protein